MKIALFIVGKYIPSSRFRILQYIPELEKEGIQCKVFALPITKFGFTLSFLPSFIKYLFRRTSQLLVYFPLRYLQIVLGKLDTYDAVFIQKPLSDFPSTAWLEKQISKRNKNIIFDIDDAVYYTLDGKRKKTDPIPNIAALAKIIITSNSYLAEYINNKNKTIILQTTVNRFFVPAGDRNSNDIITIGWTGTKSNYKNLSLIKNTLLHLSSLYKFKLIIISDQTKDYLFNDCPFAVLIPWNASSEIDDLQKFDIGIMPLIDNNFNKGKAGFKLIQYMAIGIPSIASPVGINTTIIKQGIHGFLASTEEEWFNAFKILLENPQARNKMGKDARREFETYYSPDKYIHSLKECFTFATQHHEATL